MHTGGGPEKSTTLPRAICYLHDDHNPAWSSPDYHFSLCSSLDYQCLWSSPDHLFSINPCILSSDHHLNTMSSSLPCLDHQVINIFCFTIFCSPDHPLTNIFPTNPALSITWSSFSFSNQPLHWLPTIGSLSFFVIFVSQSPPPQCWWLCLRNHHAFGNSSSKIKINVSSS